jgi:hypothetical protein
MLSTENIRCRESDGLQSSTNLRFVDFQSIEGIAVRVGEELSVATTALVIVIDFAKTPSNWKVNQFVVQP